MRRMVKGFDCSMYQGDIDWSKVRNSGFEFAVIKVTDGIKTSGDPSPVDPKFERNWKGALQADVVRGAYVFSRPAPGRNPATEVHQALAAIEKAGGLRKHGDLPLVLDIEWSSGLSESELEEWVLGWIRVAKQKTGKKPIIYTGAWWRDHGLDIRIKARLWLAAYVADPDPYVPHPSFRRWSLWQKSSTGHVPGIDGDVDINVFRGSEKKLRKLATLQRKHGDHDNGNGGTPAPHPHPGPKPPKGAPKSLPRKFYKEWAKPWQGYGRPFEDWLWDHGFVSPNFTRQEWACKCGEPVPSSLRRGCQKHGRNLEKMRHLLGDHSMPGISFYRPRWYNEQIGGASDSRHIYADAMNISKEWVEARGRAKVMAVADHVFKDGGLGVYPWGAIHVDSRGYRARWNSW